jgi:hypothetical protein
MLLGFSNISLVCNGRSNIKFPRKINTNNYKIHRNLPNMKSQISRCSHGIQQKPSNQESRSTLQNILRDKTNNIIPKYEIVSGEINLLSGEKDMVSYTHNILQKIICMIFGIILWVFFILTVGKNTDHYIQ